MLGNCGKLLLDYGGNKDANSVENVKLNSGIYVKVCNNGSLFKINFSGLLLCKRKNQGGDRSW